MSMAKSTGGKSPLNAADADAAADAFTPAWASEDADEAAEAFKPAWATDDDTSGPPATDPMPTAAAIVGAPVISVGVSPEATKPLAPAPGVPPPPDAIVASMHNMQGPTKTTALGISPAAQAMVQAANATSKTGTTLGMSPAAQALVDAANAGTAASPAYADTVRKVPNLGSDTVIDVGAKTLVDAKGPTENAFATTAPMLERPVPSSKPAPVHVKAPASSARPVPIAAVDPFRASTSDEVDLSVVKPKSSKGLVFGALVLVLAAGGFAFYKFGRGGDETTSKPADTASALGAIAPTPTNDIPPPPPKEEVTPPPPATPAAAASTTPPAKTAEPPPKAPEPPPVTHAARPEPREPRMAAAPPPRHISSTPPPKTPPKPAGGGIVRDSPF
jgi:hypothetical protein